MMLTAEQKAALVRLHNSLSQLDELGDEPSDDSVICLEDGRELNDETDPLMLGHLRDLASILTEED